MTSFLKDPKNLLILALLSFCLYLLVAPGDAAKPHTEPAASSSTPAKPTIWTCSMHPEIRYDKPGVCPICAMELIPATEDEAQSGPWELKLSPEAVKLAEITTTEIGRQDLVHTLRLVGKVVQDEQRVSVISARVPARIDRLFVDFTGMSVKKGDHLADLYSAELITAQQELRQAKDTLAEGSPALTKAAQLRVEASRKKLELLGLSPTQIEDVSKSNTISDHLTIFSPVSGVVIEKHVNVGAYVETGMPIYTVADLSRVWVVLEAYESDLVWLRFGQTVDLELQAFPGEKLTSRIVFIDPAVNPETRTVKVRLNLANPKGLLKPDMFVRATVQARLSPNGKALDPSMAGKWICPMHPDVVEDHASNCPVCGMALVTAKSLGLLAQTEANAPLVIPTSAALITGERAVVYVALEEGRFEGREVELGAQTGGFYAVKSGLKAGDRVVTNGAFKIDSELQIRARSSMMYLPSAKKDAPETKVQTDPAFQAALKPLFDQYVAMQTQLNMDQDEPTRKAAADLAALLPGIPVPKGQNQGPWIAKRQDLQNQLAQFATSKDIAATRRLFQKVSVDFFSLIEQFGAPLPLYRFTCPMAFGNEAADWLQTSDAIANPYMGQSMSKCGTLVNRIDAPAQSAGQGEHRHD